MPAAWPDIIGPDYSSSVSVFKPATRSRSEAGYMQSRAKVTGNKDKRALTWNLLSNAQYETLRTFFVTNQGGSFYYTDPTTETQREYTFADDELMFTDVSYGHKSGTLKIEEV